MDLATESNVILVGEPPAADDREASERPSRISVRTLAISLLLLGATVASFTWAMSSGSSSSKSLMEAVGGDGRIAIGLAEVAPAPTVLVAPTPTVPPSPGDIRIRVCRDTNCDKFHPHGLVHEYDVFLNKCDAVSSSGNGKYCITGATSMAVKPEMVLTVDHCNVGNNSAPRVHHQPFSLTVGQFKDCCSLETGGCGFKCIAFPLNEVPPVYGGPGMDGGEIRIKVCHNEDCDKVYPNGLIHEYTANLNTCAQIRENPNTMTDENWTITGATAETLAEGTVLTANKCGETEKPDQVATSLIVDAFTDCCSFREGWCGLKCITFKQAVGEPSR
mmetsp:Transcript_44868/g.86303  ORF Transcript_44868/g.86303 Transcript_44868/m.86303 type:complete len:332 (+) Transcript_44868:66-1061(+)